MFGIRAAIRESDIIVVHSSIIRSLLEYTCSVWHPGLIQKISEVIKAIKNAAENHLSCRYLYADALIISGLERLDERRKQFTTNIFEEMKNVNHLQHFIQPNLQQSQFNPRKEYTFLPQ